MNDEIRLARPEEFEALRSIEVAADRMFLDVGIGPFQESEEYNHLTTAAVVFVIGDPAVGFACAEVVDGAAHLWQVSVHPEAGRSGRGSALVDAVCRWAESEGLPAVTLTTFRDVAWNGPFYALTARMSETPEGPSRGVARGSRGVAPPEHRTVGGEDIEVGRNLV